MHKVIIIFCLEGFLCWSFGMNNAPQSSCELCSLWLMFINTLLLLVHISKKYAKYKKVVIEALVLSLFLKVLLILWDYYGTDIFILPNSHADSENYHLGAIAFSQYSVRRVENYSYIIGVIYSLFGIQRMTAQYFNLLFSFVVIDVFESTLRVIKFSEETRSRALVFAALLPNYLIISSILIRECLISVIICFSMFFYTKWWIKEQYIYFLSAFILSLVASYFHSGSIAIAIGISLTLILTKKYLGGRRVSFSVKSIALSVVGFFAFMFLFDVLQDSLLVRFHGLRMSAIDEYINEHSIYEAKELQSTYTAGIPGISGLLGIIINSPIRMFYFLWVPLPWMIRGLGDIIAFFGSSLFYGGTPLVAFMRLKNKKKKHKIDDNTRAFCFAILLIALSGALVFAWGVDSAGSALRHREKFYFVYLLLFAASSEVKRKIMYNTIR